MLIDTDVIIKLNFVLCGNCASFLLSSYLENKFLLSSITKQVPFIVDFLVWHKDKHLVNVTQETTNTYLEELYQNKSKSYADVIRSYLKSFCVFLNEKGLSDFISFSTRHKGREEDPNKLHKVFNYYKYLGIQKSAEIAEIKKAYHNKARSLHPDVNTNDPKANDRVIALNKIYDTLKSDNSRLAYDVTMGYADYDDEYLDSLEDIIWHDREFYLIWI